jgi:hypothetical protein
MSRAVARTIPMEPPKRSAAVAALLFVSRFLGAALLSTGAAWAIGLAYPSFADALVTPASQAVGAAAATAIPVALVALASFAVSFVLFFLTRPRR